MLSPWDWSDTTRSKSGLSSLAWGQQLLQNERKNLADLNLHSQAHAQRTAVCSLEKEKKMVKKCPNNIISILNLILKISYHLFLSRNFILYWKFLIHNKILHSNESTVFFLHKSLLNTLSQKSMIILVPLGGPSSLWLLSKEQLFIPHQFIPHNLLSHTKPNAIYSTTKLSQLNIIPHHDLLPSKPSHTMIYSHLKHPKP